MHLLKAILRVGAAASRVGDAPEPATEGSSFDERHRIVREILASEQVSKIDVVAATGLTPAEFLVEAVRTRGGEMRQKELVEATGWSESSVSRLLGSLETDDEIHRVRIGREKIVYLNGAVPECFTSPIERV